ncbi:MAG: DUF2950 family protein [Planctomycetota bacterium]|jgi:hypothetical protein
MNALLMTAVLVFSCPQDPQEEIKDLKKKVADLEERVASLEQFRDELKALISGAMKDSQKAANERNASGTLKTLAMASIDFRSNDRDDNGVNDFWVADVRGLYSLKGWKGEKIHLIEAAAARADADPSERSPAIEGTTSPKPKAGYLFAVVKKYEKGDKQVAYADSTGHNYSKFAFAAYPADYPKSGKLTFIINEYNTVFMKDTGGKPPEAFPEDPQKAGWKLLR